MKGINFKIEHLIRGGSWNNNDNNCRVANRNNNNPTNRNNNVGFRCASTYNNQEGNYSRIISDGCISPKFIPVSAFADQINSCWRGLAFMLNLSVVKKQCIGVL